MSAVLLDVGGVLFNQLAAVLQLSSVLPPSQTVVSAKIGGQEKSAAAAAAARAARQREEPRGVEGLRMELHRFPVRVVTRRTSMGDASANVTQDRLRWQRTV